jgi:hypothetical protein
MLLQKDEENYQRGYQHEGQGVFGKDFPFEASTTEFLQANRCDAISPLPHHPA